jgi:hypothetical protein
MGIDMRKNIGKIGSIVFLIAILFSETAYAFSTTTMNTSTMMTENNNPNPPEITGPSNGKINKIYSYSITLTDPDGDDLTAILIEWGGTDSDNSTYICWTCGGVPKPNGTTIYASHSWSTGGTYTIRAKIWDTFKNESDWGTLTVTMPYSSDIPHLSFLERLLERFPHAAQILQYLLRK